MKKIYHLKSCSTCVRILKELSPITDFELQNIKEENIDAPTLDWLKEKMGSYEALFSKKAMKYKSLGLDLKPLTEDDYRTWLLKEYTFLKRPFIIVEENVFIGNNAKVIDAAKLAIHKN
jgi:arsenate reductase